MLSPYVSYHEYSEIGDTFMIGLIILTLVVLGAFGFVVRYVVRMFLGKQPTCHNSLDSSQCEACMHAMQMRHPMHTPPTP